MDRVRPAAARRGVGGPRTSARPPLAAPGAAVAATTRGGGSTSGSWPTCPNSTPRCAATSSATSTRATTSPRTRIPRPPHPHLRPHPVRRGPGPLAHAAAHAGPALPRRLHDPRRRPRPGQRSVGPRDLGRRAGPPAHPPAAEPHRAVGQLPHPVRGHGPGRPGAGRGHPRPGPAGVGAQRRRSTRCSPGATVDDLARDRRPQSPPPSSTPWAAGRWPSSARPASSTRLRAALPPVPEGAGVLDVDVALLAVDQAKGLEFDSVVLVEPAAHHRRGDARHRPAGPLRGHDPHHPAPAHRPRRAAPAGAGRRGCQNDGVTAPRSGAQLGHRARRAPCTATCASAAPRTR